MLVTRHLNGNDVSERMHEDKVQLRQTHASREKDRIVLQPSQGVSREKKESQFCCTEAKHPGFCSAPMTASDHPSPDRITLLLGKAHTQVLGV